MAYVANKLLRKHIIHLRSFLIENSKSDDDFVVFKAVIFFTSTRTVITIHLIDWKVIQADGRNCDYRHSLP